MFPQLAQHCYVTHIKAVLLLDIPSLPGASGAIRGEDRGSARSANSRGAKLRGPVVNQPTTFVGCLPCHVFCFVAQECPRYKRQQAPGVFDKKPLLFRGFL